MVSAFSYSHWVLVFSALVFTTAATSISIGMSDSPAKSGVSQASIKSGTSSSRLPSLSAYSEPITVNVPRMPSGGVGISIVGGNTELEEADGSVTRIHGIFIKHVLPDSPAGASGQLKSGDRVLEVRIADMCSV